MRICVFYCHPDTKSFCHALAARYVAGARRAGHEVEEHTIAEIPLAEWISFTQRSHAELPDVLRIAQQAIGRADHIVFAHPVWWGGVPAQTKLFIELVFQSGFAFKYHKNSGTLGWDRLLKGKSARIIATMDTPPFVYRLFFGDPSGKMLAHSTLWFSGIAPVKKTYIGAVHGASEAKREKWLRQMERIGHNERI
jgi:NAD(P)H dehydrogenase (quinone)